MIVVYHLIKCLLLLKYFKGLAYRAIYKGFIRAKHSNEVFFAVQLDLVEQSKNYNNMKFLAVVFAIVLVVQLADVSADKVSFNDLMEAYEEQQNIGKY